MIGESMHVLVVDDEQNIRKTLRVCLESAGYEVSTAATAAEGLDGCKRRVVDVMLLDMRLGTDNGLDLIHPLLAASPWLKIVVMTAYASVETAVEAMRQGAHDYVGKPFTPEQIRLVVGRAATFRRLEERVTCLEREAAPALAQGGLIFDSRSPAMERALALSRRVAEAEATVLLGGGSGTGKSVLARAIHSWSRRSDKPFHVVSCPTLSGELLASDLFGHVKGAFTGALRDNPGRIAASEGGTVFLDEIADLPLAVQPKLLRFLQDRSYERLGDVRTRQADVRLIAATHVDLREAVAAGRFREDLYYRLSGFHIELPSLTERREDIPALVAAIVRQLATENHRDAPGVTPAAMAWLTNQPWPGNLRELRNCLERAVILCDRGASIDLLHLPTPQHTDSPRLGDALSLADLERRHIQLVLESQPSLQDAARVLGIDQATLWRKRKQYGLS